MFKKAFVQLNKFYDLDLNQNAHADEIFEVLNEIIKFDNAGIFYITASSLNLEYGKDFEIYENIKLDKNLSDELFDRLKILDSNAIKQLLKIDSHILCNKLTIKDTVVGILVITRCDYPFSTEEEIIFQTCTKIISDLIKNLELTKILKSQVQIMEEGFSKANASYKTIKRQNEKIKQHEKLQNQFIANVSHDFRTPLNSIIGFSEALQNKIFGELNPKQLEYISEIRIAGISLLGMINEILDISKLESKTLKLNLSEIDINLLITEVCNILEPLANKKNIKLEFKKSKNIKINGDYIKLQQVFFNIIGNAIKFSNQRTAIKIGIAIVENEVHIKIQDYGIGIDKKYHKKIFNKFFQVQDSLSKTEASTGLGLAISKEFIKLHKGKIIVDSELDKGTTFTVILKKN